MCIGVLASKTRLQAIIAAQSTSKTRLQAMHVTTRRQQPKAVCRKPLLRLLKLPEDARLPIGICRSSQVSGFRSRLSLRRGGLFLGRLPTSSVRRILGHLCLGAPNRVRAHPLGGQGTIVP